MSLHRCLALLVAAGLSLGSLACSDDDEGGTADSDASETSDPSGGSGDASAAGDDVERPDGPVPTVAGPLTGGAGINLVAARGVDLEDSGWVEEEFTVEGTATSYVAAGGAELPTDGAWDLDEDAEAAYRTRVVVRRPGDAADFDGTVVVEWLNVSAGFDASPDFTYMADELTRGGYAWVGVSAQAVGVEGGAVAVETPVSGAAGAGLGLKGLDPERYGDLDHPGDAFSYDIYTQVLRALRAPGEVDPLGGLAPERLLAVGESQSAIALTTYANGVHPLVRQADGFLIHSRAGAPAPLVAPGEAIDIAGALGLPPTQIRTDLDVPVLTLQTETDVLGVLGSFPSRQPDSDRFRLWEVAGTAHADLYQVGSDDVLGCPVPINAGPHHFVVKAGLRALDLWVRDGTAPPEAPRIEVDDSGGAPVYVRDEDGIVAGGIRTPLVDVPVDVLSGEAAEGGGAACLLSGSTTPLPDERVAALHSDAEEYLAAFEASADEVVEAGFVLPEDRDALLDEAQPDRVEAAVG